MKKSEKTKRTQHCCEVTAHTLRSQYFDYMDCKHQRDTSAKLNLVMKAIKQTNKDKLNHPSDGLVPTDDSSIPRWSVSHQMFPDFSTAL